MSIFEHDLNWAAMRDCVLDWLANNVSSHRLQHILGVEQMSIHLARCHQIDADKAAKAGLMHDLAKFFPPDKLLAIAQTEELSIDPVCANHPHLLHADVSAVIARKEFDIKDPEILEAISNHTLGSSPMSKLSCVVFIADALEPNRGDNPELNSLRLLAEKNLYKTLQQTCDYSLRYLIDRKKIIHPRTILTRNWALTMSKKKSYK
ncbi:MAG: bis(5'-nucleosyl)-tetraphosphatase (symmetrical) YqeK [Xenococcaceae cyanobacterium MO_188.B29]|nr:bis(5'-nucleosyl)-tetraphosphatase (symmetrical) YqeK [Xenococcaceae cyanobacterium MO_188.B29]